MTHALLALRQSKRARGVRITPRPGLVVAARMPAVPPASYATPIATIRSNTGLPATGVAISSIFADDLLTILDGELVRVTIKCLVERLQAVILK